MAKRLAPDISPDTDPGLAQPMAIPPLPPSTAAPVPDPGTPPDADMGQQPLPEAAENPPAATPTASPEVQQDAAALAGEPSKERHTAKMHEFDARKTANGLMSAALDVNDPDYSKKLLLAEAQHGQILRDEARYKEAHPWGSMESAHPGVLGKIGHAFGEIGNVAGAALAPGLTSQIPGSQLNLQGQEAQGTAEIAGAGKGLEQQAQIGQQEAAASEAPSKIALNTAQAAAAEREKPVNTSLQQTYADAVTDAITKGVDPATDPKVQQIKNSIQDVQKPGANETKPPHVTYDQGIPVSVTKGDQTFDVNDPKLPEELKPLVQAATRAHGQAQTEQLNKEARAETRAQREFDAKQNALSNSTKTMVESAPKVLQLADRARKLIEQQQKTLGPAGSRWAEFMAGKVGAPNPEFTKLRTDVGLLSTLLMRMHVGARGGEYIMKHFQDLIDTGKQSPENLTAALDEITQYAQDVQREGEVKGVHAGGAGMPAGAPAGPPPGATHIGTSKLDHKKYYLDAQGKKLGPAE